MKTEKQVEKELEEFIGKYLPIGSNLSVEMVKKWVYEESGAPLEASHKFQDQFLKYFKGTKADLNDLLQMTMECWNAFPHKTLKGKSPSQMVIDSRR